MNLLENLKSSNVTFTIPKSTLAYGTDYDLVVSPNEFPTRGRQVQFRTADPPFNTIPPVRNLNFTTFENGSIKFTWRPPSDEQNVDFYEIYYMDVDQKTYINETEWRGEEWMVHNNEPCSSYQFIIFANIDGEQSDANERLVTIESKQPSEVESIEVNSTSIVEPAPSTTLQVTWKPPLVASRCSKFYIIQFWRKHPRNGSDDLQFLNVTEARVTIINLDACEVYKMQIVAAIDDANHGKPLEQEISAKGRIPAKVNMLSKPNGTSTTLQLLVKNDDMNTVCQLFVAKFVCTSQGTSHDGQEV